MDAALQLVDADGADALSMRSLAQRLNSGTATLYRHFANRSQLVAQVVDRVFGEVIENNPPVSGPWEEACATAARGMFGALARHPGVAQLVLEQIPTGPGAMILRERSIQLFLDNGFAPDVALRTYATISRYVLGFGIQLVGDSAATRAEDDEHLRAMDLSEFPATMTVAHHMPVPIEDEFEFGLQLLIGGLKQLR